MAQKIEHVLVSDLSGEELDNGETVEFGIDRVDFEIDLDESEAADLRAALADYVAHARRVGKQAAVPKRVRTGGAPATVDREQNQAVRAFAKARGYEISNRGRIPSWITEEYHRRRDAA